MVHCQANVKIKGILISTGSGQLQTLVVWLKMEGRTEQYSQRGGHLARMGEGLQLCGELVFEGK